MNAAPRRTIAITRGAIAATKTICDRSRLDAAGSESPLAFRGERISLLSRVRKRPSKNTLPYHYVRRYRDGTHIHNENKRFLTFPDRVVSTYKHIQQHHAELQSRGQCDLSPEAQAQLRAQQQLARESRGGACFHGSAGGAVEVPVSAECSHSADCRCCVWMCSCCLHVPNSSKPRLHSLRLDLYRMCFTRGGSVLLLPPANPKGPPETCDSFTLSRPCLRYCASLWVWLFAVQEHVSCKKQG